MRFGFALVCLALAAPALADGARPADRKTIAACIKSPAGNPDSCIGKVSTPCMEQPGGSSTSGMVDCSAREMAVWDERLNEAYRKLVAGDLGQTEALPENRPAEAARDRPVKGAEIIRDMQRSWLAFRARKCDVNAMTSEGGTLSRVLYGGCVMTETGRQALFLQSLDEPQ